MIERRVYVAGVGAITPLGEDWASSLARLASGQSAVAQVDAFDVSGFPSTAAARITERFSDTDDRRLALAQRAAHEAWLDAEQQTSVGDERLGIFIGAESGRATISTVLALSQAAGGGRKFDHDAFGRNARALAKGIDARTVSPAAVASALAEKYGAQGPAHTISIACASGLAAIIEATRAIRLGVCDVALCGGVGADVDPLMLVGFGRLSALSTRGVSCPFDVRRDGFVVGEGAAMVVLTNDPARAKGAAITGCARTLDAYHLTKPEPSGDGARRAMQGALADAGRSDVHYVQAHGTSTPLNDEVEAKAIRAVFKEAHKRIWVSAVKGALGHWVAGAGAVGFLCGLEAVRSGVVLPTAGLKEPDSSCELRHVMNTAQNDNSVRAALVNAFAFGGANASIVIERTA